MTPDAFFSRIVAPTLPWLTVLPGVAMPSIGAASVLLMAIAGQESRWSARRQNGGPARSYWQFEKGGGVMGLFRTAPGQLNAVCRALDIPCNTLDVFEAMAWNDTLACAMARLLLWTDPAKLPAVGDKEEAWNYYLRCWRPGLPHPETWSSLYDESLAAIVAASRQEAADAD